MSIKINKYLLGEVRYCDCMDEKVGLPSIPDKKFDLCLTDPPYNKNYKGCFAYPRKEVVCFNDNIKDYPKWCSEWFAQLKRICKRILITPGANNLEFWFTTHPKDLLFHYKKNGTFGTAISHFNCMEVYLYFEDKISKPYFNSNVIEKANKKQNILHSSPKQFNVWFDLISQLKLSSVIDPFLGSGTTGEVCTKLGIPWLGYELKEVYKHDIDLRIKGCKPVIKTKQEGMF